MKPVTSTLILLTAFASTPAWSQARDVQVRVGAPEGAALLPELGAVIVDRPDGAVEVDRVADPGDRAPNYVGLDIEAGDIVLAVNGDRVRAAADLAASYDSLATGQEVALGLRRGERRWIERFVKADPEDLPQSRRVEIRMEGDPADMVPLLGLGVFFQRKAAGEPLEVVATVPGEPGAELFQAGDELVSINGEATSDPATARELWEGIAPGASLRIAVRRDGSTVEIETVKPEFQGRLMRRDS